MAAIWRGPWVHAGMWLAGGDRDTPLCPSFPTPPSEGSAQTKPDPVDDLKKGLARDKPPELNKKLPFKMKKLRTYTCNYYRRNKC